MVLGAGLAGLSTACELVDRGFSVRLLEKRSFAGGRVYSFFDPEMGCELDNGQHVFLKGCTAFRRFLLRIGALADVFLQERTRVAFRGRDGSVAWITESGWPPPFHGLPSLLAYTHLTLGERLGILKAAAAMRRVDVRDPAIDRESFHEWLRRHRQTDPAIDRLWDLMVLSILNEHAREVSAAQAIFVFQEGFLKGPEESRIGYCRKGQGVLSRKAVDWLTAREVRVDFNRKVKQVVLDGICVVGVEIEEEGVVLADVIVSALPHPALLQLLPEEHRDGAFFSRAASLGTSPIVNVYLWFDRDVIEEEFVAFVGSKIQWVFNKSLMTNGTGGSWLDISLSGARDYVDVPREKLVEAFVEEVRVLLPAARKARLLHAKVLVEREATFWAKPGSRSHRLPAKTPLQNFFLAGDWTDTGWPSTMEGAVRSGITAMNYIYHG